VSTPLVERWRALWPDALAAWSRYTQLRMPRYVSAAAGDAPSDMLGQLAAIRLRDQTVMVNVDEIERRGLADHGLAILAHEIGHHVYVPGNLSDHARLFAQMRRMLGGLPDGAAHLAANLYADLLLNDRLERRANIAVHSVYQQLRRTAPSDGESQVWRVYSRTMEHLWRLGRGTLTAAELPDDVDGDALLLARIVRSFASDWLRGARRFAVVLYRHMVADQEAARGDPLSAAGLADTRGAAATAAGEAGDAGAIPDGLAEDPWADDDDSIDELDGDVTRAPRAPLPAPSGDPSTGRPGAQRRTPFEYGQLLRALGIDVDARAIVSRYYRELALPHLIPFPTRRARGAVEPLPEGEAPWEATDPIESLDAFASMLRSPIVVPGVTTVQRVYGESPGEDPAPRPLDLDIYIDCSGSMPDPTTSLSYLALAATILTLSALRAGARVQATLWSDAGRFDTSHGFIRDERRLLALCTGYVPGGTAFPLHILRDTYSARKPDEPPAHVVVISDDGADTMLQKDERGTPGLEVCREALRRARGGGTLVLNLPSGAESWPRGRPLVELGFRLHAVSVWDQLVAFARAFVRETYAAPRDQR
jgi:hypothetical protein